MASPLLIVRAANQVIDGDVEVISQADDRFNIGLPLSVDPVRNGHLAPTVETCQIRLLLVALF